MLRAFLFDFDGTLFDTEPLHYQAMAGAFAARGISLGREQYFERYLGFTDREAIEQAIEDAARADLRNEVEAIFADKATAMARLLEAGVPLCDGAAAFVTEAARRGPLAIVSGALRREIVEVLERSPLAGIFPVIVAADDVRSGKPDPEGYLRAVRELRGSLSDLEPGACLAIEDAPSGIVAARAAGLRVLALAFSRPREELAAADWVVEGFRGVNWEVLV